MRRAAAAFAAILLLICTALPVYAQTGATGLEFFATVSDDGSCAVTARLSLHLDSPVEKLTFPLPKNAHSISVNGISASTSRQGDRLLVDLSGMVGSVAGDVSLTISYTLPDIVALTEGKLVLTLPMLCGFDYPVDGVSFSITLPGEVPGKPTFTSTYHQTLIEQSTNFTVSGNQIVGNLTTGLMDSDWLTVTLSVSNEMFPQGSGPIVFSLDMMDLSMILCAVAAVLYWLLTMRCLPPRLLRRSAPPDGVNAGDMAAALTHGKSSLTMMVVQWAQLGYILIQLDDNGRVLLHKRMNMGNERSQYENRIFRSLFARRGIVDGTGLHYAQLARKVAAGKPGIHGLFQRKSGNPAVFRLLAALIGGLGGVVLGSTLGADSVFEGLLATLLAVLGAVSAWFIQEGGKCLHLRVKTPLWVALGLCAVWLVLGTMAGEFPTAAGVALGELFAGIAAAYGGQRTEVGKQALEQSLGLRRFLKTATKEDLQRILRTNPDYFYTLAPYALALGVDRAFAKRFGAIRLSACPYLTAGMDGHMTALEWSKVLHDAVHTLDERQNQLFWERLLGR